MIWLAVFVIILGPVWSGYLSRDDLKIRLYSSDGSYDARSLRKAGALFTTDGYDSTRDLVIIILGHHGDQENMIQQTVQALLNRKIDENYNIMAVDLPRRFAISARNFLYLRPAINVPSAGRALGKLLNTAIEAGAVSADKVNVISFGLGAQIAGYMGRKVNGLIHSITGVDPSGIGFDWSRVVTRLKHVSQADAKFVHLYHSNSARFGTTLRLGTADYHFNSGETQVGCRVFDLMCSHLRGFSYYLEALRSTPGLPALQCNNFGHLIRCKCYRQKLSHVGFPLDTSATGLFYLRTREEAPFSLGKDGVNGIRCKREKTDYIYQMGLHYNQLLRQLKIKKTRKMNFKHV